MAIANIEKTVCEHLAAVLGVPASTRAHGDEAEYVRAFRTGGVRSLVDDRPRITVDVWAGLEEPTQALAERAYDALMALGGRQPDGSIVYGVEEVGGLANDPDPTTSAIRYTFTVELHLRRRRRI